MKDKLRLIVAFIIVSLTTYSVDKKPLISNIASPRVGIPKGNDAILGGADEVEIDLNNNTLKSKSGVNIKQGNMELKAFDIKRDVESDKVYVNGELQTLFISPVGNLGLQSLNGGNVSLKGNTGTFYNNFGYLEVGKVTGAIKPNDRIYFGGDVIEYKNDKISINDGWFTTDFKVANTRNPNNAGYHLLSKNIVIEPDKQVTFKGTNFYNGSKKRTPFAFPWYRMNIRQGSQVPLFPEWGTDTYYGWNTSVGVLYGNKGDKFVGGFAPKFADRMGLLVGRWENWYKTDNFGTAKLDIDDWLIWAKDKKDDKNIKNDGDRLKNEERSKRHRVTYTHEYNGDKGNLYLNVVNGTYNMIPKLDDIIVEYANNSRFANGQRPDLTNTITFYSMDSDLKDLGPNKDISIKSKLKLTSDKKAYALMVYDDISDIAYGSQVDNDLFAQVEAYKDNKNYKIGGYYNYLYDVDPGSTFNDTQSRAEDFGFEFLDKDTKMGFTYDEKNGDKFRRLGLWERDPNNESKVSYDGYDANFKFDYVPSTVKEYSTYDSRDLRVSLGEYELGNGYKVKPGYDFYAEKKILDLTNDKSRSYVTDARSRQYNRFENIVYKDYKENKAYIDIYDNTTKFTIAGGTTKDEFWDRQGIYTADGYLKYINNSEFYEVGAEQNEISLGRFGELALFGGLRYDRYKDGYNPYTQTYATGHDSTIRSQFKLNHTIKLFDNMDNPDRNIDFAMTNDLKFFYQRYDYDSGSVNFGKNKFDRSDKEIRLVGKENIYQVTDSIKTTIGNTETTYTIDYKRGENPGTKNLSSQLVDNKLDLKIDDKQSVVLKYGEDKKYTDMTKDHENYNNFTFRNYGIDYYIDNHKLSYSVNSIDSKIWDIDSRLNYGQNIDNTKEKIRLHTYAYEYKFGDNRLGLDYSEGTDKRHNYTLLKEELNVKNRIYGVSFLDGGDEVENHYRVTYETYAHREPSSYTLKLDDKMYNGKNSDIISFSYEYKDRRFSQEELQKYAELEYNKDSTSLTPQEIYRIRDILRNRERNSIDFKLNDNIYSQFDNIGDYKRNIRFNFMLQKNDARYKKTGNYWDSLEKIQVGAFYSQNRFGFGYQVEENAGWSGSNWRKTDREHKISLVTRIGQPSEGWTLKTYAKFYENLSERVKESEGRGKSALDGIGVEVGKEMGYYQWSVAFEKQYVLSARDYEWRTALQFTLLTFPENPLFGIGAKTNTSNQTRPDTYLFNGIKVDKVLD